MDRHFTGILIFAFTKMVRPEKVVLFQPGLDFCGGKLHLHPIIVVKNKPKNESFAFSVFTCRMFNLTRRIKH